MIMSYNQGGLVELLRLSAGLAPELEQVRYMTPSSHRRPLCNPTDSDGGLGAQLHRQFHLQGMALAPARHLLSPTLVRQLATRFDIPRLSD
jgi:hypothetical protein